MREVLQMFELDLPWPPTGNHSTRHARGGSHYKTPAALAYRARVASLVVDRGFGGAPSRQAAGTGVRSASNTLRGPLALDWVLAPPSAHAVDLDNVRKEAADALTLAGLWTDDSNRVIREERFRWAQPCPPGAISLIIQVLA